MGGRKNRRNLRERRELKLLLGDVGLEDRHKTRSWSQNFKIEGRLGLIFIHKEEVEVVEEARKAELVDVAKIVQLDTIENQILLWARKA